ncbi:MAG: N-6 DNA methylase [Holophagales bacterium]|nr:N-6 DNA methylase [Holophagales bacterium]MYH24287.1 N-6 DNA methylase [Holophagales bacterium]
MSALKLKRDTSRGLIWSHVRRRWLVETPEETVRQQYLLTLCNEYGFALDQIAEEMNLTGRGSASARADLVIWRTAADKVEENAAFIIVECKSDNVTIKQEDYDQGENYARLCDAPFFVTHNSRETKYWRVEKGRIPGYIDEIENIPHGGASDQDVEELVSKLRVFREKEFADLLHKCHNVIRNREKKDPAAAFDEIAKILFVKVYAERQLIRLRRKNVFSVDVLREQIDDDPLDGLFQSTKRAYAADRIFDDEDRINLKPATGEEIVSLLEAYNLSDTSEDIKGVAFERFLGRTFRGEIGQFFTPRCIVEFMVHMVNPQEGEIVCDPASGSGGFLIRTFEIVRQQILADADREYGEFRSQVESDRSCTETEKARKLREKYSQIQKRIDHTERGSRLWTLSNRCLYGTDANDRMARTSKMNMIMHGDGHGGVHHHDGFLNVNGIFEGRFDIVLTNPPFGANVEPTDKVLHSDVAEDWEMRDRYVEEYGDCYRKAQDRLRAAVNRPITTLFDLPRSPKSKIKTEVLFVERCLDLLKPGGRLGIVLPEGVFNNPSLAYVRAFVEARAFLRAVVSLPQETFVSSGASVKCSLLFLQKFTEEEKACLETLREEVQAEGESGAKARRLVRERFDYPIFMYEAKKVGISATGEEDDNELYPNGRQPDDCATTCLDLYREFLAGLENSGS